MAVAFQALINAPELAELLGVSTTRLRQLVLEGVLKRAARGQFALPDATQAYCQHMRDRALGRSGPAVTAGEVNEQERLTRAKADLAELDLQLRRGAVISSSDVGDWWDRIISTARTRLLAIPSRAAPLIIGSGTLPKIQSTIESLLNEALSELSSVNPIPDTQSDARVEAAAETDAEPVGRRRTKAKPRKQRGAGAVAD